MRAYLLLSASLFLTILTSCNNSEPAQTEPEIIKIDIEAKDRPMLDVKIEAVIPIETSENCLLSWVGDFKYFENRFYFLNNDRFKEPGVLLFDDEGNFIRKTRRGKGPGEMIEPFAFTINEEASQVFVHDQAQSPSHIFDLDLNFVRQVKHDYIFMSNVFHISQDTFLVAHHIRTTEEKTIDQKYYTYTLYTEDFSKENHLDILVEGHQGYDLVSPVSNFMNKVLFMAPYHFDVYQLQGGKEILRYILDFGKYGLSEKELEGITDEEYRDNMIEGKVVMPGSIFQTKDFLVFLIAYKEKAFTFLQSAKSKDIFCLNDSNLFPENFILRGVTDNGILYGYLEADKFIEYQESTSQYKDLEVSQDDNPYVIMFKIKEPKN